VASHDDAVRDAADRVVDLDDADALAEDSTGPG
jgi:hypothetical protein